MMFLNPADIQRKFDMVEMRKREGSRYGMPLIWASTFAGKSTIEIANPIRVYAHDELMMIGDALNVQGIWFDKPEYLRGTFVDHGRLVTSALIKYASAQTHDMESQEIRQDTWSALGPHDLKEHDMKDFPTAAELASQRFEVRMQEILKQMRKSQNNKIVLGLRGSERDAIVAALKEKGYTVNAMQGMIVEICW